MLYIPVLVLLVVGVALLVVLVIRSVVGLRRFRRSMNMVVTDTRKRVGLLRARSAALRVAFAQREDARNRARSARERPRYDMSG